jgi:carbon monoxide dehydrogenase subunit G
LRLSGSADLEGAPAEVFERLLEPALLARCIPGCEGMREVAPGVYETTVKAGVGMVKGRFDGVVTVADVVRPERYRLSIEGKSAVGHLAGEALIRLEATPAGTRVHYEGEPRVSGLLASVGGRLIDAAARKVARDFFERLAALAAGSQDASQT